MDDLPSAKLLSCGASDFGMGYSVDALDVFFLVKSAFFSIGILAVSNATVSEIIPVNLQIAEYLGNLVNDIYYCFLKKGFEETRYLP